MKACSAWAIACVLAGTGCAPNASHQKPWPGVKVDGQTSAKNIAVIEFDEQGDFWDTAQLKRGIDLIKSTPRPLLVTYVHGWRHDARASDTDLQRFKEFIDELNHKKPAGYTACGLYIGWRGASVDEAYPGASLVPALASFWNRKRATERVADIGLCRVLTQTASTAWKRDGRVVAIGHSFGGRILEKAVGMSAAAQAGNEAMTPLADLTILINPASESLTARKIKLALQQWKKPHPLIIAVGSTNDFANGVAWKYGYRLSPQSPVRNYVTRGKADPQKHFLDVTVTNDGRQLTHAFQPDPSKSARMRGDTVAFNLSGLDAERHQPIYIRVKSGQPPQPYLLHELNPREVEGVDYVIDSDAYWAFQVPTEVFSKHGGDGRERGIFNDSMTDLMCALFAKADLRDRADGGPKVAPTTESLKMEPAARSVAR
jgi:hypothetical protein